MKTFLLVAVLALNASGQSGTMAGANQAVTVNVESSNYTTIGVQLSGTWSGTVQFEGSQDCATWVSLTVFALPDPSTGAGVTSTTANGNWTARTAGLCRFRVRVSAYTSGTVYVAYALSAADTSTLRAVQYDSSGNVVIGTTIPTYAPASSVAAAGNLYGANASYRTGNTLIVLGDSITGASTSYSSTTAALGMTWPNQVNVRSNQRIRYLYNAGVSGNTCAQMRARNATDVIARQPAKAALMCATNDVGNSVPFATTISEIQLIIQSWIANGIAPILCTIPPRDTSGYIAPISRLNAWIRSYAQQQGITLVDFYSILADPTTSFYKSGYSSDGIHPTSAVATTMADFFVTATTGLFPTFTPYLPQTNANGIDLTTNNLFVNGSPTPTGWNTFKSSSTCTDGVTANSDPGGNWYQRASCTATGTDQLYADISTGYSAGDVLAFVGKINTSGATAGSLTYTVQVECLGGTYWVGVPMNAWTIDTTGTWYLPFTVTAGTTNVRPKITVSSGTGTLQVTQVGVINLTTQQVLQ